MQLMKAMCDIEIVYEDSKQIQFHYLNCVHCQLLRKVGLYSLSKSACDSDWVIAEKNINNWTFTRTHQIGTGDTFCNHTYYAIIH
jgi:hypothetical protein